MKYSNTVSIKILNPEDMYSFIEKIKREYIKKSYDIAREYFMYSPYEKGYNEHGSFYVHKDRSKVISYMSDWVVSTIFVKSIKYNFEQKLFMMSGLPICMQYLFDGTYDFQNVTDQNYDYEYWKDIKSFSDIANKWKNASDDDIKMFIKDSKSNAENFFDKKDYYAKVAAYNEILQIVHHEWFDILLFRQRHLATLTFVQDCIKCSDQYRSDPDFLI